ncbi:MAG: hypothetical protein ACRD2B_10110 [Terriglobia bacterium]
MRSRPAHNKKMKSGHKRLFPSLYSLFPIPYMQCWKCGGSNEVVSGEKISRSAECPGCGADLRCCRNCEFYDPSKHNQCAETEAEWVRDKEAANYCDYFRPGPGRFPASQRSPTPAKEDIKKKFDSLFR